MNEPQANLQSQLDRATESSRYMVAVWRVEDGQLKMYRVTENFPKADFDIAVEMLHRDLADDDSAT